MGGHGHAPRPNVERPDWDEPRDRDGFRARRFRIGRRLGTERLGASLWEVPPGEAAYPYHLHLVEEELVVVLSGTPSLRTPAGWRDLEQGEVVSFPRGEGGAHQIANRTEVPVRLLAVSTNGDPDVVLDPDSGKLGPPSIAPTGAVWPSTTAAPTPWTTGRARSPSPLRRLGSAPSPPGGPGRRW